MTHTVRVELGPRSYDVRIAPGLLKSLGEQLASLPHLRSAMVISDSNVAPLYARAVMDSLKGPFAKGPKTIHANLAEFPAGETHKTLATCERLFDALFAAEPSVDRDTIIVALGGGVTGDMAGFVAATALRGLRWVQCPTTLLAAVDASVGGKTGVDHSAGKNLIGAFHQPCAVCIDVQTLATLSPMQLATGLAECVKHGAIRDPSLLEFLENNDREIFACDSDALTDLVARNVAIKAAVVSADEKEAGVRAHLNFGHTIGHAVETLAGYDKITHGQAVSLGMVAANQVAVERGLIDAAYADRLEALLGRLHLPVRWERLDHEQVLHIMQHDKKTRSGQVRMVLPTGPGQVEVFSDVSGESIQQAVRYLWR